MQFFPYLHEIDQALFTNPISSQRLGRESSNPITL